mgnify:FL=1
MTKLTLDEKEYDIESMTDEQKEMLNVLNLGQNSIRLLNHMMRCVQSVQQATTAQMKNSLEETTDE